MDKLVNVEFTYVFLFENVGHDSRQNRFQAYSTEKYPLY